VLLLVPGLSVPGQCKLADRPELRALAEQLIALGSARALVSAPMEREGFGRA
jgi:hypothetical protein